jgi:hypothetical protein
VLGIPEPKLIMGAKKKYVNNDARHKKKRKKKKRYQPILGTLHAEIGETAGNTILEI